MIVNLHIALLVVIGTMVVWGAADIIPTLEIDNFMKLGAILFAITYASARFAEAFDLWFDSHVITHTDGVMLVLRVLQFAIVLFILAMHYRRKSSSLVHKLHDWITR